MVQWANKFLAGWSKDKLDYLYITNVSRTDNQHHWIHQIAWQNPDGL
jgi:hypothetical protein